MDKRAKKPKQPKDKTINLSCREYRELKRRCYREASDRVMLLLFVAAKDEMQIQKMEPEQIEKLLRGIAKRTDRYADAIEDKVLQIQDMQEDLQGWLGRNVTGFSEKDYTGQDKKGE